MTNPIHDELDTSNTNTWALNALTEALGDLTVTVSESLSVGRGSDNDVVLGSKQVSRNHAVLSVLDGQLYVKDLDSSNGTFINNERIEGNKSSLLQVNDTIGFASFNFQVNTSVAEAEMDTPTDSLTPVMADDAAATIDSDTQEPVVAEPIVEETITQEPVIQESVVEEPIVEESIVEEPTMEAPAAQEPVVKKTNIEEMLPVKDDVAPIPHKAETAVSDTAPTHESANTIETSPTPVSDRDTLANEPVVHKEPVVREEPIVQPEHDKTTKTELQEEADPEVLHAKQAATAQFSGTANLGQGHDLGTTGNNAMDQAVDNPATTGQVDKKPSGGWFIWVFIALIIIGVALWLFNMGGAGA
ncbi:FHA domain-containing protein [Psychrobacter alimentarius]|uniref:FHA domain-containing protein n=1 Tax=Psychrobacter alimentarius TaxID=261164 RepID=UPI0019192E71|nr:FHA domain-containing protein [Psychrobacter alimentarius]